jgi:hypothetical protein
MANTTFSGPVISNNGFIGGTASSPIVETTAGNVSESYVTTSAATGDTRLSYNLLTFTSTGSGETIRALTRVTGAVGAAHLQTPAVRLQLFKLTLTLLLVALGLALRLFALQTAALAQ